MTEQIQSNERQPREDRYLLFRIGTELYGTPLLDVREIVEPHPFKAIPNSCSYFLGVMNLRGQIVGAIDLAAKLNVQSINGNGTMIVFETPGGLVAALVDNVERVVRIPEDAIESNPAISTRIPSDYLIGIGKVGSDLISLVKLKEVLNHDDLVSLRETQIRDKTPA